MEPIVLIIIIVAIAILGIFLAYYLARLRFEMKFRQWQETEKQKWEAEIEKACKAAITQSRAVLGGKFVEQLAPYLPEFKYNPTEARFIRQPHRLDSLPGVSCRGPARDSHHGNKNWQIQPSYSRRKENPPVD